MQLWDRPEGTYADFRLFGIVTQKLTEEDREVIFNVFDLSSEADAWAIKTVLDTLKKDREAAAKQLEGGYWFRCLGALLLGGRKGYVKFKKNYASWKKAAESTDMDITRYFYEQIHDARPSIYQHDVERE